MISDAQQKRFAATEREYEEAIRNRDAVAKTIE